MKNHSCGIFSPALILAPALMATAVPVRGVGCILLLDIIFMPPIIMSCRPREGCGLHLLIIAVILIIVSMVAVPVRGVGCILDLHIALALAHQLPSP